MRLSEMELFFNLGLIGLFFVMGIVFLLDKGRRFLTLDEYASDEEIRRKSRRVGILTELACLFQLGVFFGRGFEIFWLTLLSSLALVIALVGLVLVAGEAREKKK